MARSLRQDFAEANQLAAQVILGDPQKYIGILAEWAQLVLEKPDPRTRERQYGTVTDNTRRDEP